MSLASIRQSISARCSSTTSQKITELLHRSAHSVAPPLGDVNVSTNTNTNKARRRNPISAELAVDECKAARRLASGFAVDIARVTQHQRLTRANCSAFQFKQQLAKCSRSQAIGRQADASAAIITNVTTTTTTAAAAADLRA